MELGTESKSMACHDASSGCIGMADVILQALGIYLGQETQLNKYKRI